MALHYATAKSRQQALLKWIRQSPRIPQCKRFLKMFLPPSSGSVILSLARLRTLDRAFSSGGERFPDTEEVRSSNLLTPTKCSQLRGYASGLFCFMPPSAPPNTPPNFEVFDLLECFSMVVREDPQILWVHTRIFHWFMPWAMELGMARPQHVGQALSFGFFWRERLSFGRICRRLD